MRNRNPSSRQQKNTTKNTKDSQHESLDPILQPADIEVDQQPDPDAAQFHVG